MSAQNLIVNYIVGLNKLLGAKKHHGIVITPKYMIIKWLGKQFISKLLLEIDITLRIRNCFTKAESNDILAHPHCVIFCF